MAVDAKTMETINSWSREVSQQQAERVLNEYSPKFLRENKEVFPSPYREAAELILKALDLPIDTTAAKPAKKTTRPKGYAALEDAAKRKMLSKQTVHAALAAGEINTDEKDKLYALIDSIGGTPKAAAKPKSTSAVPAQWARTFKLETLETLDPLTPTSTPDEVSAKLKALGEAAGLGKVNIKAWTEKYFKEVAPLYSPETGWKRPVQQPVEMTVDLSKPAAPEIADTDTSVESATLSALAIPDLSDL